jgi:SPP1 family predicted phage head-tail adaptor
MKLKDKKIEILREIVTKDPDGFAVKTYEPIHTGKLWAYYRQLSGAEIRANDATFPAEDAQFVINWRSDVTPALVIRYAGRLYDITRVDTFEGYKEDLTVYAARREG